MDSALNDNESQPKRNVTGRFDITEYGNLYAMLVFTASDQHEKSQYRLKYSMRLLLFFTDN